MEVLTVDANHVIQLLLTFIASLAASSGFWIYVNQRLEKKSLTTQLLLGLAHDRIVYLGMVYLKRGYITEDEYDNIHECIYKPYLKMGGNGFAKRLIDEMNKLPIRSGPPDIKDGEVQVSHLTKC